MKTTATVLGIAFLVSLAGCETEPRLTIGPGFGNAVHHNMAMHIIDPEPADPALPPPDLEGHRAAGVIDRYEKGAVIEPELMEIEE